MLVVDESIHSLPRSKPEKGVDEEHHPTCDEDCQPNVQKRPSEAFEHVLPPSRLSISFFSSILAPGSSYIVVHATIHLTTPVGRNRRGSSIHTRLVPPCSIFDAKSTDSYMKCLVITLADCPLRFSKRRKKAVTSFVRASERRGGTFRPNVLRCQCMHRFLVSEWKESDRKIRSKAKKKGSIRSFGSILTCHSNACNVARKDSSCSLVVWDVRSAA